MQISVRHEVILQDIPQCDRAFVPAGQIHPLERVNGVHDYPMLTVTEGAEVVSKGTLEVLIQRDSRMVFAVNQSAAGEVGLQVSAKMLQLARKEF